MEWKMPSSIVKVNQFTMLIHENQIINNDEITPIFSKEMGHIIRKSSISNGSKQSPIIVNDDSPRFQIGSPNVQQDDTYTKRFNMMIREPIGVEETKGETETETENIDIANNH